MVPSRPRGAAQPGIRREVAVAGDQPHPRQGGEVLQRVAVDQQEVRPRPGRDPPAPASPRWAAASEVAAASACRGAGRPRPAAAAPRRRPPAAGPGCPGRSRRRPARRGPRTGARRPAGPGGVDVEGRHGHHRLGQGVDQGVGQGRGRTASGPARRPRRPGPWRPRRRCRRGRSRPGRARRPPRPGRPGRRGQGRADPVVEGDLDHGRPGLGQLGHRPHRLGGAVHRPGGARRGPGRPGRVAAGHGHDLPGGQQPRRRPRARRPRRRAASRPAASRGRARSSPRRPGPGPGVEAEMDVGVDEPGSRVPPAPSTTRAPAGGTTWPAGPTRSITPPAATTVWPGTGGPSPPSTTATPTIAIGGGSGRRGGGAGHPWKLHRYHPGHEPAPRRPLVLHGPPDGAPLALGRRVTMYVCGITPYDAAHVGHAFTYVAFDTLARFLRARGHEVVYCQNVTDVDDDVLRRAARDGEDYLALGRRETAAYLQDMDALNVARPTFFPRATEEIPAMVELAGQLVAGGNAYVVDGTVFFDVTSYPGFGELSGLSPAEQRAAGRAGRRPRRPAQAPPAGLRGLAAQPAGGAVVGQPLGPGPPRLAPGVLGHGRRYLGVTIDLHGGGADLSTPTTSRSGPSPSRPTRRRSRAAGCTPAWSATRARRCPSRSGTWSSRATCSATTSRPPSAWPCSPTTGARPGSGTRPSSRSRRAPLRLAPGLWTAPAPLPGSATLPTGGPAAAGRPGAPSRDRVGAAAGGGGRGAGRRPGHAGGAGRRRRLSGGRARVAAAAAVLGVELGPAG